MIRSSTVFILVLVSSMIFANIPNYVYADSQTDSLVRIAINTKDQIRIQLSLSGEISEEIKQLFEQGSKKTDQLEESDKRGDIAGARQLFLEAMKIFKEITQKVSQKQNQVETLTATDSVPEFVKAEVNRWQRYLEILKANSIKQGAGVDFGEIEDLIEKAKKEINENEISIRETIKEIKEKIRDVHNQLRERSMESEATRIKSLAKQNIIDLDRLIGQGQDLNLPAEQIEKLTAAKLILSSATNVKQIIVKVKDALSAKKLFDDSKIERFNSRISQMDAKLDRLAKTSNVDKDAIQEAQKVLEKLKEFISNDNLDEAIKLLSSLNTSVKEIEEAINIQPIESDPENDNTQTDSVGTSNLERMEMKIQKLELKATEFSEKIHGNYAAKRWLEQAVELLENSKLELEESPEKVLKTIQKVEEILHRIENMIT